MVTLALFTVSFSATLRAQDNDPQDGGPSNSVIANCGFHGLEIVSRDVIPDRGAVEAESFEMELRVHKAGPLPGLVLHVGLDYDELVLTNKAPILRLDDSWDGRATFTETGVPSVDGNRITFSVSFDGASDWASSNSDESVALAHLHFGVRPEFIAGESQQANRAAQVGFLVDGNRFEVPAETTRDEPCTVDGNVNVLLRDEIEISSAKLTRKAQVIELPIRLTHLNHEHVRLEFGIDVQDDALEVVDVSLSDVWRPSFEPQYDPRFDPDRAILEFDKAENSVTLQFPGGVYPQIIRGHVLNLIVAFDPTSAAGPDGAEPPESELTVGDELQISLREIRETGDGGEAGRSPSRDLVSGRLEIVPHYFVRGDTDTDARVALNDVITLLQGIIFGGSLRCKEAADIDNDSVLGIGDGIYLLTHLFISGSPPAAPYPNRGADPNEDDSLGCDDYSVPYFEISR